MDDGHLVLVLEDLVSVGLEDAGPIRLEDPADASHAKGGELGGPQGAHACAAEDVYPLGHGPEDLLVPHGRHVLEVPVHDADGAGTVAHGNPVDVALLDRRQVDGIERRRGVVRRERGPHEDTRVHRSPRRAACARGPGT